jgi:hypothetical protein
MKTAVLFFAIAVSAMGCDEYDRFFDLDGFDFRVIGGKNDR